MNRLRELRKEKGMTMKELGARFNMSESSISLYENGKRLLSQHLIEIFSKYFDVSADYLLGLTDERHRMLDRVSLEDVTEDDFDPSTTAIEFQIEGTAEDVRSVEKALKERGIRYTMDSPKRKSSVDASTEDVKVALFGGDGEVTDEMWDEVTSFVEFVKQKHKKDQNNKG